MPHNLYLHSSIVKYRRYGEEESLGDIYEIKEEKTEKENRLPVKRDVLDRILQFSLVQSTSTIRPAYGSVRHYYCSD